MESSNKSDIRIRWRSVGDVNAEEGDSKRIVVTDVGFGQSKSGTADDAQVIQSEARVTSRYDVLSLSVCEGVIDVYG